MPTAPAGHRLTLREVTWSAVCIGLGLAAPIAFHAVGLGSTFLPMFLPILAAGFLLRPVPAGLTGALTPPLSALLTGMPPLMPPVALVMAAEGLVLGGLTAVLRRCRRWNAHVVAGVAVLAARLVLVLATMALAPLFGLPARWSALGLVLQGLPGVALLIGGVPLLVAHLPPSLLTSHGQPRC